MSVIPGAREVLSHLNYLGYTNINAHQLKEFMIDLKRFIKYDEQCQNHQNHQKHQKHQENQENQDPNEQDEERDIFESLHHMETVASRAKKKLKSPKKQIKQLKQHVITVEINRPQTYTNIVPNVPKIIIPESDVDENESRQSTVGTNCPNCQCSQVGVQTVPPNTISAVSVTTQVDSGKSMPSTSKSLPFLPFSGTTTATNVIGNKRSARSKSARSSFIRPKVINKPAKSDPVALYHQYKQEWDKIKFPGEHHHGETRWAVREKLLGDGY